MKNKTMCISKQVTTTVYSPMELTDFITQLKADKPKQIFHSYYSKDKPCYIITEYLDYGVMVYADAWADKTPKKKTFEGLQREFNMQGVELFYYHTK